MPLVPLILALMILSLTEGLLVPPEWYLITCFLFTEKMSLRNGEAIIEAERWMKKRAIDVMMSSLHKADVSCRRRMKAFCEILFEMRRRGSAFHESGFTKIRTDPWSRFRPLPGLARPVFGPQRARLAQGSHGPAKSAKIPMWCVWSMPSVSDAAT